MRVEEHEPDVNTNARNRSTLVSVEKDGTHARYAKEVTRLEHEDMLGVLHRLLHLPYGRSRSAVQIAPARIKAEGLARISRSQENQAKKELLSECFNNYLELSPPETTEFDRLWEQQAQEVWEMVSSFEVSGRLKEKREIVRKQLEVKFGPLPPDVVQRLGLLTAERLDEIILKVWARTLGHLAGCLQARAATAFNSARAIRPSANCSVASITARLRGSTSKSQQ